MEWAQSPAKALLSVSCFGSLLEGSHEASENVLQPGHKDPLCAIARHIWTTPVSATHSIPFRDHQPGSPAHPVGSRGSPAAPPTTNLGCATTVRVCTVPGWGIHPSFPASAYKSGARRALPVAARRRSRGSRGKCPRKATQPSHPSLPHTGTPQLETAEVSCYKYLLGQHRKRGRNPAWGGRDSFQDGISSFSAKGQGIK